MDIQAALAKLDQKNDTHWTSDGLPKVDVVAKFTGQKDLSRQNITDAAPAFNRETMEVAPAAPQPEPAVEVEVTKDNELTEEELKMLDGNPANVVELSYEEVCSSCALMSTFIDENNKAMAEMNREAVALKKEALVLAKKNELVDRVLQKHLKADGGQSQRDIRAYLDRAAESRAERAKRAKAFIESGTTVGDVAKQLQHKSQLDQAMTNRKPGRGSQRPNMNPAGG